MRSLNLTAALKSQARSLGFVLAGATPAVAPAGLARFHEWLEAGYAGEMKYLAERAEAYAHPRSVLDGVRSLLMLAMPYRGAGVAAGSSPGQGRVASYAWGSVDYHDLIHDRLHALADWLRGAAPGALVRGVVDTAPLLEREYAELAGLGWVGKNTLLLNRQHGSWFFLAALLTDLELEYDAAPATDHCGTCRACLDACPTGAFPAPYVLDATRCISYLTIELRSAIPAELRQPMGDWLFGCDVCQDVCPWNRHAPEAEEPAFAPASELAALELIPLFWLDEAEFRRRFRQTPLWRPRRRGLLRNAAIVLGNQRDVAAIPALARGLADEEPLVRGASAWALGQIGGEAARAILQNRERLETDAEVRREISAALFGERGV